MVKKVTSYKILTVFAAAAVITLTAVGYWFADEKSEQVYLSKIDRLMFDKDNKAPKFVLTLPKPEKLKEGNQALVSSDPAQAALPKAPALPESPLETLESVIDNIPNLNQLPTQEATQKLRYIVLDEKMTESESSLILPKIAEDGRKPWDEYGKSVEIQPNFKKVALIIKGLGFDPLSMDKVVKGFASEVSLSLTPYAPDAGTKILPARQFGHETYVDLLLSSKDFLKSDSGPMSMSQTISPDEALQRLKRSLSTGAPIGGVIVNDGMADEDNFELLTLLFKELRNRGLLMIDATHGDGIDKVKMEGLPRRKADVVIDEDFRRESIKRAFARAEEIAFNKGQVVVVVDPKPVAIMEAYKWIESFSPQVSYEEARNMELTKPFALVPISNLVME